MPTPELLSGEPTLNPKEGWPAQFPDRLAGMVFATVYGLLPSLTLLAPLAAAPLIGLLAVLVLLPWLWMVRDPSVWRRLRHDGILCLTLLLLVWAGLSLTWSAHPIQGATLLPRVILVLTSGIALHRVLRTAPERLRMILRQALAVGVVIGLTWLTVDLLMLDLRLTGWLTNHPYDAYNIPKRGLTLLSIFIWPAAATLWPIRRISAAALISGTGFIIFMSDAGAAKLGFCAGALTVAISTLNRKVTAALIGAALCVSVLATPFALPRVIDHLALIERTAGSVQHRLAIWTFVSGEARKHILLGWGFNTSRSHPGGTDIDPVSGGQLIPLHPHNAPLQWWLELGLPGAVIGLGMALILLYRTVHITDPVAATSGMGAFTAAATICLVGYGAWQLWWLSSLALVTGAVTAMAARQTKRQDHGISK